MQEISLTLFKRKILPVFAYLQDFVKSAICLPLDVFILFLHRIKIYYLHNCFEVFILKEQLKEQIKICRTLGHQHTCKLCLIKLYKRSTRSMLAAPTIDDASSSIRHLDKGQNRQYLIDMHHSSTFYLAQLCFCKQHILEPSFF